MHNSTHWGIYENSSDYDTVTMNDKDDKYADAKHSDEVDHPAVLVMIVLMKLKRNNGWDDKKNYNVNTQVIDLLE